MTKNTRYVHLFPAIYRLGRKWANDRLHGRTLFKRGMPCSGGAASAQTHSSMTELTIGQLCRSPSRSNAPVARQHGCTQAQFKPN